MLERVPANHMLPLVINNPDPLPYVMRATAKRLDSPIVSCRHEEHQESVLYDCCLFGTLEWSPASIPFFLLALTLRFVVVSVQVGLVHEPWTLMRKKKSSMRLLLVANVLSRRCTRNNKCSHGLLMVTWLCLSLTLALWPDAPEKRYPWWIAIAWWALLSQLEVGTRGLALALVFVFLFFYTFMRNAGRRVCMPRYTCDSNAVLHVCPYSFDSFYVQKAWWKRKTMRQNQGTENRKGGLVMVMVSSTDTSQVFFFPHPKAPWAKTHLFSLSNFFMRLPSVVFRFFFSVHLWLLCTFFLFH